MKALLICPEEREGAAALAENVPLAAITVLGRPVIEYWLEHLVAQGAREICILASDRSEEILALVGDGARWGLCVTVHPEAHEMTPDEARAKYRQAGDAAWLPAPHDATLMDHLPRQPEPLLFTSYAAWFTAVMAWLPRAAAMPNRIGMREIQPGVWIGLHTRVAADAELHAPCWLGENVFVGSGSIIGPQAVVEDGSFIGAGGKVSESIIGPETFVGEFAEVRHSIAWGSTLVNWQLNSCLKVPDAFMLCGLKPRRSPLAQLFQPLPVAGPQIHWPWKFKVKTEP